MATYRENPIEPGRYWADLIGQKQIDDWASWKSAVNGVSGAKVAIVGTSHHEPSGEKPVREWVLFEVKAPVAYDYAFYAPINTAEGVSSETDTVTRPDPKDSEILPSIDAINSTIKNAVTGVVVVVSVVSLASFGLSLLKSRKRR